MKRKTGSLVFLFVALGVGCHGLAQQSPLKFPPSSQQVGYKVITKDEVRNGDVITIVSLERMSISEPDLFGEPIGFSSMFVYEKKSKVIPAAYISFYSVSPTCRFPSKATVLFTADGHSVSVSDDPAAATRGEGSVTSLSEPEGNNCRESIDVLLPQSTYLIIANAHAVEVQIQGLRFHLNESHLNAMRELAGRMTAAKA